MTVRGAMTVVRRSDAIVAASVGRPVVRVQAVPAGNQVRAAVRRRVGSFPASVPRLPATVAANFAAVRVAMVPAGRVAAAEIGASVLAVAVNRWSAGPM